MPISLNSDGDNCSIVTQLTSSTALTFADSLPSQLTRKTCKRGFTFNVMSVGPPGIGKTTLLSSLFNKNLDVPRKEPPINKGITDFPVEINTKTFDIEEKGIRLRLSIIDCQNYGASLNLCNTYKPIVQYIEQQFSEYHKRESGHNRRDIQDTMVHCLFFFISAIGHGLTELDIQFLKAVHEKVNIIPIIAKADALTQREKDSFKRKVKADLEQHCIEVYEMADPEPDDPDEYKRDVQEIKNAVPFAVSSMQRDAENKLILREYCWGTIDLENREHSDYMLLKTMLHMNMSDLRDRTNEFFYEEYRVKMMASNQMRSYPSSTVSSLSRS